MTTENFFEAVRMMRENQKGYFRTSSQLHPEAKKHFLVESKKWETIVDNLLVKGQGQQELF